MTDTETVASPADRLAIFTDLDGTLIEIADTPDTVDIPDDLADDLERAAAKVAAALAVVSGREIADIDAKLAPAVLPVAGSHGAHRRDSSGRRHDLSEAYVAAADRITDRLASFVDTNPGLILESKAGTVALHYRLSPDLKAACQRAILGAIEPEIDFRILEGKMVYEARPAGFSKGAAIRAFMSEAPFAGRVPIFLGDDVTDEEGFRAVQDMGGVGIKVGDGESEAQARIPDVSTARALLRRIGTGEFFASLAARGTR